MASSNGRALVHRLLGRLPEHQQCAIWHWIDRRTYQAERKSVRRAGQGAVQVTQSLRSFDERRCIFVHIPKAAGISVATALFGHMGGGHIDARDYCKIFGPDFWRYFKFTFVRNPYERLVSAYEYLNAGGHPAFEADRIFQREVLSEYTDFSDFVLRWLTPRSRWPKPHFRPQHEFVELGGRVVMDFVGRVEQIHDDFRTVCARLGLAAELRVMNARSTRAASIAAHYTSDAVERRVQQVYAKDFDLFGYSPRPPGHS